MNKQEIEKAIEAIKKFKHFADLVESPDEYFQHMQGHTKELSLVLNVFDVADLCDDIVKLLNQQLTNGWIPVSEQLPETNTEVLVTYSSGDISVDFIQSDGDWFWEDREEGLGIVAWQPLPEPYKEVSDANIPSSYRENILNRFTRKE